MKNLMVTLIHDPMSLHRVIRWLEILLVIMIGVALARLVAELVAPAPALPERAGMTRSIDTQSAGANSFQASPALVQLFGTEIGLADVSAASEQPLQQTSLNLTLKGILADQGTNNRLALIAVGGQKERVYRMGDRIEGADIVRIEPRRVVIRRNGVTEALDLEVRKLPGMASNTTSGRAPATFARIRNISDTERVIPLTTYQQQLANLPSLLQQAQAVPQIEGGEQKGFRIVSINQGSVFEQLGIRQNDIIHAVNDIPVRNVAEAMNAYRTLSGANSFKVGVIRNGRDMELNLSVQ